MMIGVNATVQETKIYEDTMVGHVCQFSVSFVSEIMYDKVFSQPQTI